MIDFFASLTVALIIVMTVVIFISNQRQAGIMKQMRLVLEDWYQAQMRIGAKHTAKRSKCQMGCNGLEARST